MEAALLLGAGAAAGAGVALAVKLVLDRLAEAPFLPRGDRWERDGCSGFVSLAWRVVSDGKAPPFEKECEWHDKEYAQGGPAWARRKSDERLRDAILASGRFLTGWTVFAGVRVGGWEWWPTRHRWGFARFPWPTGAGKQAEGGPRR